MKITTVERLRFKRRTFHVPNLMHKLLEFILKGELWRPLYIVKMNVGRRLVRCLVRCLNQPSNVHHLGRPK